MGSILTKFLIGSLLSGGLSVAGYGSYQLLSSKTIKEVLKNKNLLSTETHKEYKDNENWEKLEKKYREENKKPEDTIENFVLEKIQDDEQNLQKIKNINKLKDKCKNLFDQVYLSEKDKNYLNALNWCTESSKHLTG